MAVTSQHNSHAVLIEATLQKATNINPDSALVLILTSSRMKPLRIAPYSNLVIKDMSPPPCNYERNNNSYDIREELHAENSTYYTYTLTTCLYIGTTVNSGNCGTRTL